MDFIYVLCGGGVLGLGVTVRMKGIFATTNPLSRFFFLPLGVAPIFLVFFLLRVSVRRQLNLKACGLRFAKKH